MLPDVHEKLVCGIFQSCYLENMNLDPSLALDVIRNLSKPNSLFEEEEKEKEIFFSQTR